MYKNFNTKCVMHWHLIIKEFGPQFEYLQGEHNIVADALTRLKSDDVILTNKVNIAEIFCLEDKDLPNEFFPLHYKILNFYQQKDKKLVNSLKTNPSFQQNLFMGAPRRTP